MNTYKDVFRRVEVKYLLTAEQHDALMPVIDTYMQPDRFGRSTISNIYYDTADFELVRKSLEKPIYKEKLRMRGYGAPTAGSDVFVEIKKKFKGVVYKRRVQMPLREAEIFVSRGLMRVPETQIHREIEYFCRVHPVEPKVYLAYDRVALTGRENEELRVTFDRDIRFRRERLTLDGGSDGTAILPDDITLMELKTPGAMPLWLSHALSSLEIYPTSFSKYGRCYERYIAPQIAVAQSGAKERKIIYVA